MATGSRPVAQGRTILLSGHLLADAAQGGIGEVRRLLEIPRLDTVLAIYPQLDER